MNELSLVPNWFNILKEELKKEEENSKPLLSNKQIQNDKTNTS